MVGINTDHHGNQLVFVEAVAFAEVAVVFVGAVAFARYSFACLGYFGFDYFDCFDVFGFGRFAPARFGFGYDLDRFDFGYYRYRRYRRYRLYGDDDVFFYRLDRYFVRLGFAGFGLLSFRLA